MQIERKSSRHYALPPVHSIDNMAAPSERLRLTWQSTSQPAEVREKPTTAGKEGEEEAGEFIGEGDHDGMGTSDSEEWELDDGLCEYERRRMRNIKENRALMESLNLLKAKEDFDTAGE